MARSCCCLETDSLLVKLTKNDYKCYSQNELIWLLGVWNESNWHFYSKHWNYMGGGHLTNYFEGKDMNVKEHCKPKWVIMTVRIMSDVMSHESSSNKQSLGSKRDSFSVNYILLNHRTTASGDMPKRVLLTLSHESLSLLWLLVQRESAYQFWENNIHCHHHGLTVIQFRYWE